MRAFVVGFIALLTNAAAPRVGNENARALLPRTPNWASSVATAQVADSIETELFKESTTFFVLWSKWWRISQSKEWPASNGKKFDPPFKQGLARNTYQHCHTRESSSRDPLASLSGKYAAIGSATSAFSICPSWSFGGPTNFVDGLSADESDDADAAINLTGLPGVRAARAKLIASHERALRVLPGSPSIVGQYVRFLLDQKLPDSAAFAARSCQADRWWCQLLRGYVEARRHDLTTASFVFDSAMKWMPDNERCTWVDIAPLLPASLVNSFESQSCEERMAVSNRLWWLSDPMFSQPGNERRAEHFARNVRLMLVASMPTDGRFQYWNRATPSDALRKLVLRYGWPGYLGWGGDGVDTDHDRWLQGFSEPPHGPYTTYEYYPGRIHTTPNLAAVDAPFSVADSMFDLNGNAPADHPERWWPVEHMSRPRKLTVIPEGQLALLRRDDDVLLATAHNLRSESLRDLVDGNAAITMVSPYPDSLRVLNTQPISKSSTLRQQSRILSASTLFAVEISDPSPDGIDARTRRGIEPPKTLKTMTGDEVALSEPVMIEPPANEAALSAPTENLLAQMLGSTVVSLAATPRIGVYWESYGIRDGDTVSVSVRLERRESLSAFRRIGMALNVANDPNSSVRITWREPDRSHVTSTISAVVPIQIRTVVLGISNLSPGPYDLITEIVKGSGAPITSSRRISVVK